MSRPSWLEWLAIAEMSQGDEARELSALILVLFDVSEAGLTASALLGEVTTAGCTPERAARIVALSDALERLAKRLRRRAARRLVTWPSERA